jgi:type II secretory pathway pseudopilin PulG
VTRVIGPNPGFSSMRRRGLSVPEVLVAIGVVLVLASILLVGTRGVRRSLRMTLAQTQLALLAEAMDRYAQAWPAWCCYNFGQPTSDRGWPHWNAWAAFPTAAPDDYTAESGFNDPIEMAHRDLTDDDAGGWDDLHAANETLAYALTAPTLTGERLVREQDVSFDASNLQRIYPRRSAAQSSTPRRRLYDPWGTPFRYLWVVRDTHAHKGWRAITSADPADRPAGLDPPPADPFFWKAEGFVLESAGPDGRFGNVWKRNPTSDEIRHAEDNLTIQP